MKGWLAAAFVTLKVVGLGLVFATNLDVFGSSLFAAGSLLVVWHHFLPRSQGLCDVVKDFAPRGRQVWLTIDDGPDQQDTPAILDLLEQFEAKATFFMIGKKAASSPDLVREVVARGHGVGCHTYSHPLPGFWCASRARVCREVDDGIAVLRAAGAQVQLYRSPAGIKNVFLRRCLRERNLSCVAWSVRSGDGISKYREAIVRRVLREARPGSIILMHEGIAVAPTVRIEALRGVLTGLRARGFTCVLPGVAGGPGAAKAGCRQAVPANF